MQKFLLLVLLVLTSLSVFSQSTLKANTQIYIKVEEGISSKNEISGTAIISSPVKDKKGNVLIEQNTPVTLNIVKVKARSWGRPGKLVIKALNTTTVDGQKITLSGTFTIEGDAQKTEAWLVAIAGGCLVVPGLGFIGGFFIKGEEAKVPNNFIFNDFYTSEEAQIEISK